MSEGTSSEVWLLCETRRRYFTLTRQQTPRVRIFTVIDGCFELLQRLWTVRYPEAIKPRFLRDIEAVLVLRGMAQQFNWLAESAESTRRGLPWRLKSLIDSVRLHDATSSLISKAIAEAGNLGLPDERTEQLVAIIDAYEDFQRENARFDGVGILQALLDLLLQQGRMRESIRLALPTEITLDQPQSIFPLSDRLFRALSELTNVTFTSEFGDADADFRRAIRPRLKLAENRHDAAGKCELQRLEVNQLRDASSLTNLSAADSQLVIIEALEPVEEVEAAAVRIRRLLSNGVLPSEIHVVALHLDAYELPLRMQFESQGIPFQVSRGRKLSRTSAATRWKSYCAWINERSIEKWVGVFGHPLVLKAIPVDAQLKAHLQEIFARPALAPLRAELPRISSVTVHHLNPGRLLGAARAVGVDCEPNCSIETIEEILSFVVGGVLEEQSDGQLQEVELAIFIDLACFLTELRRAEQMAGNLERPAEVRAVWGEFRKLSKRGRALLGNERDAHAREVVAEHLRGIRALFRLVRKLDRLFAECVAECSSDLGVVGIAPLNVLEEWMDRQVLPASPDLESVCISEILDLRGEYPKAVFFLGTTVESMQRRIGKTTLLPPEEAIEEQISAAWLPERGYDELLWLWCRALSFARHVQFSYPTFAGTRAAHPAGFVRDLGQKVGVFKARQWMKANRIDGEICLDLQQRCGSSNKRALMLQRRKSTAFSEFDGLIGSETAELLPQRIYSQPGTTWHSVSALSVLHDCPHKYFFRYALGLKEEEKTPWEELELLVGRFTHTSLQRFFSNPEWQNRLITTETFGIACDEMLSIALAERERSPFAFSVSPISLAAFERIVRGLEDPSSERTGLLKSALMICREHVTTLPWRCEWRFSGEESGLRIPAADGVIIIRGVVDRIDRHGCERNATAESLILWDYKTGKQLSKTALMLQLPIYAAAVLAHFPEVREVKGGYLLLGKVAESGESAKWIVPALVACEKEQEQALEVVRSLDLLVRNGRFCQRLETETCRRCEFREICGRDESLLQRKLMAESEVDEAPELTAHHTEQYAEQDTRRHSLICSGNRIAEARVKEVLSHRSTPAAMLSLEQALATDITQSVALEAGAGSGKTAVLQSRIIRLLLRGHSLSRILAISFTEKAAEEIRARVEMALSETLTSATWEGQPLSDVEWKHLDLAKRKIASAQFTTIHSLCMRITEAASLFPNSPKVMSNGESKNRIRAVIQQAFHDPRQSSQEREAILELTRGGLKLSVIEEELISIVERPLLLRELCRNELEAPWSRVFKQLSDLASCQETEYRARLIECVTEWRRMADGWVLDQLARVDIDDQRRQMLSSLHDATCFLQKEENGLQWRIALSDLLQLLNGGIVNRFRKSPSMPINYAKVLRDRLEEIGPPPPQCDEERELLAWNMSRVFVSCAAKLREQYERRKSQLGLIDFDDLIFGAWTLLCQPQLKEGLARTRQQFRAAFDHVLVDEFQDTDRYQWELIRALIEDRPSSTTLFIVGDSKQAIYRFRGGELVTFERAKEWIRERGGRQLSLVDNYRTTAELLNTLNPLFESIFLGDFAEDGTPKHDTAVLPQSMIARREGGAGASVLYVESERGGWGSRRPEAESVARFLASRLNASGVSEQESDGRPKIAVLARTQAQIAVLMEALARENVPFSTTHSGSFFELPEIRQFALLFRSLYLNDQISFVGLLRSVLGGLSDRELLEISASIGGQWNNLALAIDAALDQVPLKRCQWWKRITFLSQFVGPAELIVEILDELELGQVYESAHYSDAMRNIRRLIQYLYDAESDGRLVSAWDVLGWFDGQSADRSNPPPANDFTSPVLLTTIHGAKGLEFSTVILPFLVGRHHEPRDFVLERLDEEQWMLGLQLENPAERYQRRPTSLLTTLQRRHGECELSEERRLFYVACTRARDELIFCLPESWRGVTSETGAGDRDKRLALNKAMPGEWLKVLLADENIASRISVL